MELQDLIAVTDFCKGHNISNALVIELREYGLIDIIEKKDSWYIQPTELPRVEKILRLHSDLDINWEGIGVITQLLDRITDMQNEMIHLQNRLHLYE